MPIERQSPHILLLYLDEINPDLVRSFRETVSSPNLELIVESRPPLGPQAALAWLLPTAVVIYLSKSYFEGFLKEAGKDHYQLLRDGVSSLWKSFFGRDRLVRITRIGSPGKVPADDPYSVTVSIMAEAESGVRFKLLFADDISAEELNATVGRFLVFLENYYSGRLDEGTLAMLSRARVFGRTRLVSYDKKNDHFVFLDLAPGPHGASDQ